MLKIVLDEKKLDLVVKKGDNFLVSEEGERALCLFLETKIKFDEAEKKLKELIRKKMGELNLTRVEGGNIRINKRFFGSRYKISDPELAKALGFANAKEYVSCNTKAIDNYCQVEGKMPDGIAENKARQEQVVISQVIKKI